MTREEVIERLDKISDKILPTLPWISEVFDKIPAYYKVVDFVDENPWVLEFIQEINPSLPKDINVIFKFPAGTETYILFSSWSYIHLFNHNEEDAKYWANIMYAFMKGDDTKDVISGKTKNDYWKEMAEKYPL